MIRLLIAIIAATMIVLIVKLLLPTQLGCFAYGSKSLNINDVPPIFVVVLLMPKRTLQYK